jgi:hypothetical protein
VRGAPAEFPERWARVPTDIRTFLEREEAEHRAQGRYLEAYRQRKRRLDLLARQLELDQAGAA